VCVSLVLAFKSNPFLLEFKLFFLEKVYARMTFLQMDGFIVELEKHFFPGNTNRKSLLVYQVNPLKSAMQLQEILT
jgi:hypothetical protein